MAKKLLTKFFIVSIVMMLGLAMLSFNSGTAPTLGVTEGKLAPCPESPNCVSTQADSQPHRMEAVSWPDDRGEALAKIKEVVSDNFARAKLVDQSPSYLRYEFRSLIFRFVDDVEFYIDQNASLIHFRSASRVGHSDLGANKSRMQKIVAALQNRMSQK